MPVSNFKEYGRSLQEPSLFYRRMVEPENNPSFLEEKENLRVAISRRMLEIYSSRLVVVNSQNRNEIPITLNKPVQDEIDAFTIGREKDFFLAS